MTTVSLYSEVDLDDETEAITLAKSSVGFETVVGGGHVATSGVVTEEIGLFTAATSGIGDNTGVGLEDDSTTDSEITLGLEMLE